METMTALLRIAGDLNMTVQVQRITPAEAYLLMHVHDPAVKDVFEGAVLTGPVDTNKVDERQRLRLKYPEHVRIIDQLFPGRNAADVPDSFSELQDVPLTVTKDVKRDKARATHDELVHEAQPRPRFAGMRFPEPEFKIPAEPGPSRLVTADSMRQDEVAERARMADAHRKVRAEDPKAFHDYGQVEKGLNDPRKNPKPYDPGPESTMHATTNEGEPNPNFGPDVAGRNIPEGYDEEAAQQQEDDQGPTDEEAMRAILGEDDAPAPKTSKATAKKK